MVLAHPDDETLCSGAMAKYAAEGRPVTMLCATRGEVGQIAEGSEATAETLGKFREQELRDAMTIMGVDDVRFLGFRDSGMAGTEDNEDQRALAKAHPEGVTHLIVRAIRELKPAVVVTWDETGGYGHPDHIAVHQHTTAAFHAAGDASRFTTSGEPHQAKALFYAMIPIENWEAMQAEMLRLGLMESEVPGDAEAMQRSSACRRTRGSTSATSTTGSRQALRAHRTQAAGLGDVREVAGGVAAELLWVRDDYLRVLPALDEGVVLDDLFAGI